VAFAVDWETVLKFVGAVVALGGTAVALAKYFAKQDRTLALLRDEIRDLKGRTKILSTTLTVSSGNGTKATFEQLMAVSGDASKAVGAAFHSISVPVPLASPTDLKIILSTDPQAEKVLGREFPINKGLSGWVYQRKQPSFKNPGQVDQRHFELVDKAAGTKTGDGAILTMPLVHGGVCRGVIQFMKPAPGMFDETDVAVASRLLPSIARVLVDLEDSPRVDIPSIAHGDARTTTIVFSDIAGFSAIADKIRLEDSVAMLNEYYSRLLPHATGQGGKLEEYVGDGMYLSFSRDSSARSAQAAVTAAFAMHEEYRSILEGWKSYQHPVSDRNSHCIGVATGIVYSGLLGHPGERRTKLVGAAVNRAAHLCAAGKAVANSLLICPRTRDLLDTGPFEFEETSSRVGRCYSVLPRTG
jgi:class 3 adenylate cyclase